MEEKDFEKKPKKKGIIITVVILVLIALIAGGVFAYFKLVKNKPQAIFEKAISKVFEMTEKMPKNGGKVNLELTASLNSTDQDMSMANTYLKMFKLNLTTEKNDEKKVINQNVSISALDETIVSADLLIQNNKAYVFLKDIYSKYIELPEDTFDGFNLNDLFESDISGKSQEMLKEIKQILLDAVKTKELKQENVEVDDQKLTKTTLKLNSKDVEQIVEKLSNVASEFSAVNTAKDIVESSQLINEEENSSDNYLEVSIYTKRFSGKIVKTEFAMINVEDDMAIVGTISEEDEKMEITFAVNEDSTDIKDAITFCTFEIEEVNDNEGTMSIKFSIDEESTATVTVKYKVDYNDIIEPKNVRNSINANDLTEEDMNEMMTNIENNEFLYSIIQSLSTTRLMEKAEENAKRYEEEQIEREQLQEELLNTELTENI
mgnify:CR=1 FL=1